MNININKRKFWFALIIPVGMLTGCKKEFLEKPPTDAIVDANFYKTDEQVAAATSLLYNKVWFNYNDLASFNIGDVRAGVAFRGYNERDNVEFTTSPLTTANLNSWQSLFNVIGQSNLAIANINRYAGGAVSASVKRTSIAEARFMRALAYSYLTMNWGDVPVIEDNISLLDNPTVTKNTVKSVWRFITREMRAAADELPADAQPGRVTKWSAEGMLARFYLTRAGVESAGGVRKQEFLDSAKYYSQRVITLSGKKLMSDYPSLFRYPYDNNSESLFELQWVFLSGDAGYGIGNSVPSHFNFSGEVSVDGWGGDKAATWWMLSQYDGFTASGDTMLSGRTVDQRLKATFMLPGFAYPEITRTMRVGADMVDIKPFVFPYTNDAQRNFANIKKYTVGQGKDIGIPTLSNQRYPNNTYMMRLAEMYLIYAEATLGNSATTNDATALGYFNDIRRRAGLSNLADASGAPLPLTLNVILKERFKEFAMEAMAWYDLVRVHYTNPQMAYSILNSQDRGFYYITPDSETNPTNWVIKKTPWANPPANPRKINANASNFVIPIPAAEMAQAPWLANPAVEYP